MSIIQLINYKLMDKMTVTETPQAETQQHATSIRLLFSALMLVMLLAALNQTIGVYRLADHRQRAPK